MPGTIGSSLHNVGLTRYNPTARKRPVFIQNPFTMPREQYNAVMDPWRNQTAPSAPAQGQPPPAPAIGPQPQQPNLQVPQSLLKQGGNAAVQKPQGGGIWMPDFTRRVSDLGNPSLNWSDFLAIASMR